MASLRELYEVGWDDQDLIKVRTTVQDLIDAVEAVAARGFTNNKVALETSIIHCALERTGVAVPAYEDWVLVLDVYERIAPRGGVAVEGPTAPTASPAEPSPSPVSPGPPGDPGSAATPEP